MRAITFSRRSPPVAKHNAAESGGRIVSWMSGLAAASVLALAVAGPVQAQSSSGTGGTSSGATTAPGASSASPNTGAAASSHTPTTAPSQPGARGTAPEPYTPSSSGSDVNSGGVIGGPSADDLVEREQRKLDAKLKGICRGC